MIYWYKTGIRELYNIREDISETNDLATVQPGITNDLAVRLGKYLREVQAGRPSFKESGKACRWPDGIE